MSNDKRAPILPPNDGGPGGPNARAEGLELEYVKSNLSESIIKGPFKTKIVVARRANNDKFAATDLLIKVFFQPENEQVSQYPILAHMVAIYEALDEILRQIRMLFKDQLERYIFLSMSSKHMESDLYSGARLLSDRKIVTRLLKQFLLFAISNRTLPITVDENIVVKACVFSIAHAQNYKARKKGQQQQQQSSSSDDDDDDAHDGMEWYGALDESRVNEDSALLAKDGFLFVPVGYDSPHELDFQNMCFPLAFSINYTIQKMFETDISKARKLIGNFKKAFHGKATKSNVRCGNFWKRNMLALFKSCPIHLNGPHTQSDMQVVSDYFEVNIILICPYFNKEPYVVIRPYYKDIKSDPKRMALYFYETYSLDNLRHLHVIYDFGRFINLGTKKTLQNFDSTANYSLYWRKCRYCHKQHQGYRKHKTCASRKKCSYCHRVKLFKGDYYNFNMDYLVCHSTGEPLEQYCKKCCQSLFITTNCFQNHSKVCYGSYRCKKCDKRIIGYSASGVNSLSNQILRHRCYTYLCRSCFDSYSILDGGLKTHVCYLKQFKMQRYYPSLCIFDIETAQKNNGLLEPTVLCAIYESCHHGVFNKISFHAKTFIYPQTLYVATEMIQYMPENVNIEVCRSVVSGIGKRLPSPKSTSTTRWAESTYYVQEALKDFVAYRKKRKEWLSLLRKQKNKIPINGAILDFLAFFCNERFRNTVCIAHNMGRFDGIFILNVSLALGLNPQIISKGNNIVSLTLPSYNVVFLDSFKYLSTSLSNLAKQYKIPEEKGFFCHEFNKIDYSYGSPYNRIYENLPPLELFINPWIDDEQTINKKKEWHSVESKRYKAQGGNLYYDFNKDILMYCFNDCFILLHTLLSFITDCFHFQSLLEDLYGSTPSVFNPKHHYRFLHPFAKPISTLSAYS